MVDDPADSLLTFLIGGAVIGATALAGAAFFVVFLALIVPATVAMGMSRWPFTPLILLVVIFVVGRQRGIRGRYDRQVRTLAVLAALMLPLVFISGISFGRSQEDLWSTLASFPILPTFAVVLLLISLVKRLWPVAFGTLGILIASLIPYVFNGFATGKEFMNSTSAYDNVLATMIFIILGGLFALWQLRDRTGSSHHPPS